jgi:hypothetical protein
MYSLAGDGIGNPRVELQLQNSCQLASFRGWNSRIQGIAARLEYPFENGRGGEIRTHNLLRPRQAR